MMRHSRDKGAEAAASIEIRLDTQARVVDVTLLEDFYKTGRVHGEGEAL